MNDQAPTPPDQLTAEQQRLIALFNEFLAAGTVKLTHDEPPCLLTLNGVDFIRRGEISAITGIAKQGKTHFLNTIAAVANSGKDFGTLKRKEGQTVERIVWFDTEQSTSQISANVFRLFRLIGISEDTDPKDMNLYIYELRKYAPEDRLFILSKFLDACSEKIDLVIVDGIRDMMVDFNDIASVTQVMTELQQLTFRHPDTAFVLVLHNNESNGKARGHLGTEIINKMSDRVVCSKEDGMFTVEHQSRGREAANFQFRINDRNEYEAITTTQDFELDRAALEESLKGNIKEFAKLVKSYSDKAGIEPSIARRVLENERRFGNLSLYTGAWTYEPKNTISTNPFTQPATAAPY